MAVMGNVVTVNLGCNNKWSLAQVVLAGQNLGLDWSLVPAGHRLVLFQKNMEKVDDIT